MRLSKLFIKNFRAIGAKPVEIPIDDIVLLIGPNNVGKSSILSAYNIIKSGKPTIQLSDINLNSKTTEVEIGAELVGVTEEDEEVIGKNLVYERDDGLRSIQFCYRFSAQNLSGNKFAWDYKKGDYVPGKLGGWDTKLSSVLPVPIEISPYLTPNEVQSRVVEILTDAAKEARKSDAAKYDDILVQIDKLTKSIAEMIEKDMGGICKKIETDLARVFPDHKVIFHPQSGKFEPEKSVGTGSTIDIQRNDVQVPLDNQGTGLQRVFLWTALKALADSGKVKHGVGAGRKAIDVDVQKILLFEEPETFMHPSAIRNARDTLYELADNENWQVMVTSHSPVFIDVSRPHSSIVRVEQSNKGVKVFSTREAQFTEDERNRLRMVRLCNPYVNEFFYADLIILVEGETEEAVLSHLIAVGDDIAGTSIHVVNCMGKENLVVYAKILNQFQIPYVLIHDVDRPKYKKADGTLGNSTAWTCNERIWETITDEHGALLNGCQVVASVPEFERHYFGKKASSDKPYSAVRKLIENTVPNTANSPVSNILSSILDESHPYSYTSIQQRNELYTAWLESQDLGDEQALWIPDN